MRKAKTIFTAFVLSCMSLTTLAQTPQAFDWTAIMNAIIQVESGGNPRAFNKNNNCAGILQITPILVKDCNQILARKKINTRYTLQDRYNEEKSKEMFVLYQETYNPQHDLERAIRLWNGGPKYGIKSTEKYFQKVMSKYKPPTPTEGYDNIANEDL